MLQSTGISIYSQRGVFIARQFDIFEGGADQLFDALDSQFWRYSIVCIAKAQYTIIWITTDAFTYCSDIAIRQAERRFRNKRKTGLSDYRSEYSIVSN